MGRQEFSKIDNWKSYRQTYEKMAEDILSELSLKEKVSLMSGRLTQEEIRSQILNRKKVHYNEKPYWAGGMADKNVMPILFVDGSRGVVCGRGIYTGFPVTVLRGATFDRELEYRVGDAIAKEVILADGNLFGGCCLNLPYHPGWGRAQESYGEDTFLIGEMGASLVKGVQSEGVIACIKHFAFNSMENNRLTVNIVCDKRTEKEVFLPHFKKCIDAGAGAVMTAYNSFQGEMCGQNRYLIHDVLKKEWGFDGFVISDFTWGITDTVKAANAGMDVEMPHTYYYGEQLMKAVESGDVSESEMDAAALRIVRTILAHSDSLFENRELVKKQDNLKKEHAKLALECARKGITLLKNENHILPLSCKGRGKKIVILGTLADEDNLGDYGSSRTYPPYVIHAKDGIWKSLSGAELIVYSGESTSHCKRLAKEADAVIIFAGNHYQDEGEHIKADENVHKSDMYGGDRTEGIALSQKHVSMVDAVYEVRSDAVLVLTGGGAIMLENVVDKVGAILMQYYPGMEGGTALGEILFGKISPSGRLPFSIPKDEKDLVDIDWDATEQIYGRYHGYTRLDYLKKEPRYDFGFGLSYTEFTYENLYSRVELDALKTIVTVRNIGKRESDTVVLLFVGAPGIAVEREKRLLKGFTRIHLLPGEEKEICLLCPLNELTYYDEQTQTMQLETGDYTVFIEDLTCKVRIEGQ
ncbi:MAG: glycoside hydrolase family 3 C-terminal domain-containing protein [Lachnospiraceae bacterium]|nr:glycoside hydrolase family 3 C-terminal domain-containing protein [Lachnospiraceae bacterium]